MSEQPHKQRRADLPAEPIIQFDNTIAAIGAGDIKANQVKHYCQNISVIVADGGAYHADALALDLKWIIGDLDSVESDVLNQAENVLEITDQYSTDFEKLLACVKADLILAFGFLGGRFDHSLASLHALASARPDQPVLLIGEHDAIMFCRDDLSLTLPPKARFSVWPLSRQSFESSWGLRWPLDNLTLETGKTIGTSNEVIDAEDDVKISIKTAEGDGYFVLIDAAYVNYLI